MGSIELRTFIIASLSLLGTLVAILSSGTGEIHAELRDSQLDEVSISGQADNWLAYTFTNKKVSFLWLSTTGHWMSEYSGLNVKTAVGKRRVLESWLAEADGVIITPGCGDFTYYPFKHSRTTEGYTEEVFMPDDLDGFIIEYSSESSPFSLSFTPFLELTYSYHNFANNTLIFYSPAWANEKVAYLAITSNSELIYDGSQRGQVYHEYAFDEMRIEYRETRGRSVLNGGKLIASDVSGPLRFAVAVAGDESEVISEVKNMVSQKERLLEEKSERIASLLSSVGIKTADAKLTKALNLAVAAADSLLVEEPYGKAIWAGLPWFNEGWGRDTFISLGGFALVIGRFGEAEQILRDFARFQREDDGRIPNRVGGKYNTADATPWFVKRCWEYYLWTGDVAFLKDMFEPVKKAIGGTWSTYGDPGDGFISHGAMETWMDTSRDPREGKAVEIQALWINELLDGASIAERLGHTSMAENWRLMANDAIVSFRSLFWDEGSYFLYDYMDCSGEMVERIRPNAFIALAAVNETCLVSSERRSCMIQTALDAGLIAPHGVRSLAPSDPLYVGIDEETWDPPAYHNGDVWPWLSGPVIQVFVEAGYTDEASRLFKLYVDQVLDQANVGSIHEIMDGDRDRPKGCWTQAWSIAEFLRTYFQVFLGIKLSVNKLIVSPHPIEGVDYLSASFRVGGVKVDENYSSSKGGQGLTLETDSTIQVLARFRVPAKYDSVFLSVDGEGSIVEVDENGNVGMSLTVDGRVKIDVIYEGRLTLAVPSTVSSRWIQVSGTAPPGELVKIYVNDELVESARADGAGNYSTYVRLDKGTNVVRAEITGSWVEKAVNYLGAAEEEVPWVIIAAIGVGVFGIVAYALLRRG